MDVSKLRVAELRQQLQQRDLDASGLKAVLVARLKSALDAEKLLVDEQIVRENSDGGNSVLREHENSNSTVENSEFDIDDGLRHQSNADENNAMDTSEASGVDIGVDSGDGVRVRMRVENGVWCIDSGDNSNARIDDNVDADKKVNYELLTGKRFGKSTVLYSKDEKQFYYKNKPLASGILSYDCAQKSKAGCHRHVYLDPTTGECLYQMPYVAHDHGTHEVDYDNLTIVNPVKEDCANPAVLANINAKTSATKTIFMRKVQE